MFKRLCDHFYRRVIKDKRGVLSAGMGALYGSLISGGGGLLGGLFGGKKKNKEPQITQLPDYSESTAARENWWSKLQGWGQDPNYGAITPDWADIWSNAQNKVRQYYWGSPTQMGLAGKVKASAARRGVSDTALEPNLTAMGAEEGNQLKDMATSMGVQQTNLANQGRNTWLDSLMRLSQTKPQYNVNNNPQEVYGLGNMIGDVSSVLGTGFSTYAAAQQQNDWLKKLLGGGMPDKTQSQILGYDTRLYGGNPMRN